MAQPIYFLPDVAPDDLLLGGEIDRQLLKDHDLDIVFRDVVKPERDFQTYRIHGAGPEGLSGTILAYTSWDGRRVRQPDARADWLWRRMTDGLWVGTDPNRPIAEEDIRRKRMIGGIPLQDDSGTAWMIPKCRELDGSTSLPASLIFSDRETVGLPVKPEFLKFYNASSEALQFWFDPNFRDNASNADVANLAVFLVGLNYRFDWMEQNLLSLIDSENVLAILAYSCSIFDSVEV